MSICRLHPEVGGSVFLGAALAWPGRVEMVLFKHYLYLGDGHVSIPAAAMGISRLCLKAASSGALFISWDYWFLDY